MADPATCYMCESTVTTTEHAPPKCFFPATRDVGVDLRVGLITVPSCAEHNTSRSKDDEYAMIFVVTHFETNSLARDQFSTKCIRSLRRSPAFTTRVLTRPRDVRVGGQPSVVVEVDRRRFDGVMECTCRALFYHERQRKLLDPLFVWSPAFRHSNLEPDVDEATLAFTVRRVLQDRPRVGRNPDAFWYQSVEDPSGITAFRLMFYQGCSVYAVATREPLAAGSLTSA